MSYHAKLSPSSAHRWTSCTASIAAQDGIQNTDSEASRQGTVCHQIQAECLTGSLDPQSYLDRKTVFWAHPESNSSGEYWIEKYTDLFALETHRTGEVTVTQEMVDAVASAVAFIRDIHATKGGTLYVEQSVPIGQFTGEADATGSADVILVGPDWVIIFDSKFGRARVDAYEVLIPTHRDIVTNEVVPEKVRANLQMGSYGLGTVHKFQLQPKSVTMTIVQPFINHISEYTCTIEELREVESFLRLKAEETRTAPVFVPTQDNCHFCRANGKCEAQSLAVLDATMVGFDDITKATPRIVKDIDLGSKYALVGMVQDWCKAVEERVFEALKSGQPVTRSDGLSYKLVTGKKGNREWSDEISAIATLSVMGVPKDKVFKQTLLGPAAIEKLTKAKKGAPPPVLTADKWQALKELITQSDGKPAIALETDPRHALADATDGFDDVPQVGDNADLF